MFDSTSAEAIINIPLTPNPNVDLPLWIYNSKGTLTAKSAYECIHNSRAAVSSPLTREQWRKIWKLKLQHRLKLMLWKVTSEALPLRGKMRLWRDDPDGGLCPLCRGFSETASHLFLACQWSVMLWRTGPWPVSTEFVLKGRNPLKGGTGCEAGLLYC